MIKMLDWLTEDFGLWIADCGFYGGWSESDKLHAKSEYYLITLPLMPFHQWRGDDLVGIHSIEKNIYNGTATINS